MDKACNLSKEKSDIVNTISKYSFSQAWKIWTPNINFSNNLVSNTTDLIKSSISTKYQDWTYINKKDIANYILNNTDRIDLIYSKAVDIVWYYNDLNTIFIIKKILRLNM